MDPSSTTIQFRPRRGAAPPSDAESTPLHSSWNELLSEVLQSQRSLTVVERFSQIHDQHLGSIQSRFFRDLIPLSKPAPGQQYGFEVDLDRCSSCKACVTACHSLNGLRPGETWRNVGLLSSNNPSLPLQKTVTTACHHCVEPGCLEGCPVLAYDKDPLTGIVRHLDDQCIGCQYCILKCPYDVPKYSAELGIVRKCDLCSNRLAVGEAPACVQACPNQAIRVILVDTDEIQKRYRPPHGSSSSRNNLFLPDSPPPDYTLPTTRFLTRDPQSVHLRAADAHLASPAEPHTPLVFMLTFSQAATGVMVMAAISALGHLEPGRGPSLIHVSSVLLLASMALGATHLGQPWKAWRSFLGWRQSWLSRELLVFGAMFPLALMAVVQPAVAPSLPWLTAMVACAAGLGLLGVTCSAMLYADTRRPFWKARRTFPLFFSSTVLLGAAWTVACLNSSTLTSALLVTVFAVTLLKVTGWIRWARHTAGLPAEPDTKSARLLWGPLLPWTAVHYASLFAGGVLIPLLIWTQAWNITTAAWCSAALITLGDLIEKSLFFRAVVPLKMPGGIPT